MPELMMSLKSTKNKIEIRLPYGKLYFLGMHAEEDLRVWLNERKDQPVRASNNLVLSIGS